MLLPSAINVLALGGGAGLCVITAIYATRAPEKKKQTLTLETRSLQVDGDSVDDLPPSWQRDVEGRQTREEAEAELKANAEAANKEDAVSSKRSTIRGTRT